jgi:hypothetical protein
MSEQRPATGPEREQDATVIERRAWVRYATALDASCSESDPRKETGWLAKVRDISTGGVGLLLQHRFRPGTPLVVELKDPHGKSLRTALVRVRHATAVRVEDGHRWLLGCEFAVALSDDELAPLLR